MIRMAMRYRLGVAVCTAVVALTLSIFAQEKKGNEMIVAKGAFDVKMAPAETAHKDVKEIARYSIDKVYHGDLEATGTGEMLASMGTVKGSGTYVAMEIVSGTLVGKKGTFVWLIPGRCRAESRICRSMWCRIQERENSQEFPGS